MPRFWSLFFGLVSLVIFMTMMAPTVFGFQQFRQWGGMYTDGWCRVRVTSDELSNADDPSSSPDVEDNILVGGGDISPIVWYAPMQNVESCIAMARSYCHAKLLDHRWYVNSAFPYFRGAYLANKQNVCTMPFQPSFSWFHR